MQYEDVSYNNMCLLATIQVLLILCLISLIATVEYAKSNFIQFFQTLLHCVAHKVT